MVPMMASTILAWLITVLTAFLTNKQWVFGSDNWQISRILNELITFMGCRIFTGILELIIMYVFVQLLLFNDMIIKMFANVIVIVTNYVASKFIIFKH